MVSQSLPPGLRQSLQLLPTRLQILALADKYNDAADLIPQLFIEWLSAGPDDTLNKIYNRARSTCRRFTQDPLHRALGLEDDREEPDDNEPGLVKYREYIQLIVDQEGITRRAAQIRVKKLVNAWEKREREGKGQLDLFADFSLTHAREDAKKKGGK